MRKWHRWLSIIFGVFMAWIAITGVASQLAPLWLTAGNEPERGKMEAPAIPEGFVCPETMMCRPKPPEGGGGEIIGLLHHLHSGESFGPVGTIISIFSGLALIFFSVSGLWIYVQMWRNRKDRSLAPGLFWK